MPKHYIFYLTGFIVVMLLLLLISYSQNQERAPPRISENSQTTPLKLERGKCVFGYEYEGRCLCQEGYTGYLCDKDVYVSLPAPIFNETVFEDPECQKWYSEYGQDQTLYSNFWKGRKRGFFLDLGANQPKSYSNTFFLEKCLGWTGICVEANPMWADQIKQQRKCIVENVCVSDSNKPIKFIKGKTLISPAPADAVVDGVNIIEIPCLPLVDILERNNIKHFDFVSLDIDNFQTEIMRSFFSNPKHTNWPMDLMVVETFWSDVPFYQMFYDNGYFAVTDVAGMDHIFVKSQVPIKAYPGQGRDRSSIYQILISRQRAADNCIQGGWKTTEWWNALNCGG